eukprot:EG_transcript_14516
MDNKEQVLSRLGQIAPVWNYTAQFLTREERRVLVYEQLAAVDLLVLVHSDPFIGMARSTFTCFISVYRASKGLSGRERFVDPLWADLVPNFLPHLHAIPHATEGKTYHADNRSYGWDRPPVGDKGKGLGPSKGKGKGAGQQGRLKVRLKLELSRQGRQGEGGSNEQKNISRPAQGIAQAETWLEAIPSVSAGG